ncbi:alginate lyase family protein [Parashewanella spongiae]|nr:alginate lyase family protein [Parashewanella spongiae]MCL1079021.1 alginate lyase family protein [Parashewanella spongiae]
MTLGILLMTGCHVLRPSYDIPKSTSTRDFDCSKMISTKPYVKSLEFSSKYGPRDNVNNKGRDKTHTKSAALYQQETADIRQFEKNLSKLATLHAEGKYSSQSLFDCMLDTIEPWANNNALMGNATNHTGKSVRKWSLAAISSNLIAFKSHIDLNNPRVVNITHWIDRITNKAITEWSNRKIDKINNHDYWAGWAVMNSAILLNNNDYYQWALNRYRIAMSQLTSDGFLPNELKRNSRALSYHNYALIPLVMMADLAYANGDDMISSQSAEINLLVDNVSLGLNSSSAFQHSVTDKLLPEQNIKNLYVQSSLAWIPVYLKYHNSKSLAELNKKYGPFKSSRLGGNVSLQVIYSSTSNKF